MLAKVIVLLWFIFGFIAGVAFCFIRDLFYVISISRGFEGKSCEK